jgi:hypothetical protein
MRTRGPIRVGVALAALLVACGDGGADGGEVVERDE